MIKVGLFYNEKKIESFDELKKIFIDQFSNYFDFLILNKIDNNKIDFSSLDYIFAIGGDGTVLHTIRRCNFRDLKYVGLKKGNLGFLSCIELENFSSIIDDLLSFSLVEEKRFLLEVEIKTHKGIIKDYALNDIVIEREDIARMLEVKVQVNEEFLGNYFANGVIISSPTGSTAYNLSAGGPILYPGVKGMILTPICPHSLTQRPIIFDKNSNIKLFDFKSESKVSVTLDGQKVIALDSNSTVIIRFSQKYVKLIRQKDYAFAKLLNEKLKWNI